MADESKELLQTFFKKLREKWHFSL
jgi:hypothetical protein